LKTRTPLSPLEWAVMVGGPLIFILLAVGGVMAFLGPTPRPNAMEVLRSGKVKPGMREAEVLSVAGQPKASVPRDTGGFFYRYQRSRWNPEASNFTEEDAYVDFDDSGYVTGVSFDARTPSP
jgi:hypothetical protein